MKNLFKYEKFLILILVVVILWSVGGFMNHYSNIKEPAASNTNVSVLLPAPVKHSFLVKGSIPYWDQEKAYASFKENAEAFDYINLFWYYLGDEGTVEKYKYTEEDSGIIKFAQKNNVKVSAVITNLTENPEKWDSERVERIINSEKRRKDHIDKIISKLNENNFDGIIIDYELLNSYTKDNYSIFIKELSNAAKKQDKILTVVLHPKTGDDIRGESISRYQDWKAIINYADQVQIMGYSEHSDEDDPGPVAGVEWVGKIIDYAKGLGVPLEKVYLGIPLYGYDWDTGSKDPADGLTFQEAEALLLRVKAELKFDEKAKSPYFTYGTHQVWFEDSKSVNEKANLAYESGLAGVTFWRLGGEDKKVWDTLREYKN